MVALTSCEGDIEGAARAVATAAADGDLHAFGAGLSVGAAVLAGADLGLLHRVRSRLLCRPWWLLCQCSSSSSRAAGKLKAQQLWGLVNYLQAVLLHGGAGHHSVAPAAAPVGSHVTQHTQQQPSSPALQ